MSVNNIKVINGTRAGEKRLCDTCSEGIVMRGASANEEAVFCEEMRRHVPIHVVECNRFKQGGQPSLWDLREIAWVLNVDSRRQKIGFLTAAEWRKQNDDSDLLD